MSQRIIVWRHGRTDWNEVGRIQGQTNTQLNATGHAQAKAAAARLASLKPDAIISSDLSRAADTAAYLGQLTGVEVRLEPRLREMDFGEREGKTWQQGRDLRTGETYAQAGQRIAEAMRDLAVSGTVVYVSHGAAIRTGTLSFLGVPQEYWRAFSGLSNCHWNLLERQERWRLLEWNTGSLPEPIVSDEERT